MKTLINKFKAMKLKASIYCAKVDVYSRIKRAPTLQDKKDMIGTLILATKWFNTGKKITVNEAKYGLWAEYYNKGILVPVVKKELLK